jgi:hypothetical protein
MLHTQNPNEAPKDPLLQQLQAECYTRSEQEKLDEEELMMLEWLRSIHPSQMNTAVHQLSYGRWLETSPESKHSYPF